RRRLRHVEPQLHRAFGAVDMLPAGAVRAQEALGQFRFGDIDGRRDAHAARLNDLPLVFPLRSEGGVFRRRPLHLPALGQINSRCVLLNSGSSSEPPRVTRKPSGKPSTSITEPSPKRIPPMPSSTSRDATAPARCTSEGGTRGMLTSGRANLRMPRVFTHASPFASSWHRISTWPRAAATSAPA